MTANKEMSRNARISRDLTFFTKLPNTLVFVNLHYINDRRREQNACEKASYFLPRSGPLEQQCLERAPKLKNLPMENGMAIKTRLHAQAATLWTGLLKETSCGCAPQIYSRFLKP